MILVNGSFEFLLKLFVRIFKKGSKEIEYKFNNYFWYMFYKYNSWMLL